MSQVSYDGANKVDIEALKKAEEDRKAAEPIDVSDGGAKLLLLQTQAALAARRFEDMVCAAKLPRPPCLRVTSWLPGHLHHQVLPPRTAAFARNTQHASYCVQDTRWPPPVCAACVGSQQPPGRGDAGGVGPHAGQGLCGELRARILVADGPRLLVALVLWWLCCGC